MVLSNVWKLAFYILLHSRNFLASVKDGSLKPYATKEEVKKDESSQKEEDKKEEVKDEL